jgi:hypothetical protein
MPRKEDIIDLVISRHKHSADYHQPFYEKSKRYYDLFRGVTSKRGQAWRNNIHVPFAISILESDVSRKVQSTFGAWPVVEFAGYAPEDQPNARRNEVLISAQMKDADSFSKAVDFFTTADIYGTAFARVGWTTKAELEKYREPNTILGMEEIKTRETITFDGPDWEVLDMLDCFPQPGIKRIDDMAWFIIRYHLDLDEIARRAKLGVYDESAVSELRSNPGPSNIADIVAERQSYGRSAQDYMARKEEKFAKPVEVVEYWGIVPDEFGVDGVVNRVISIANERVVLRDRDFPFFIKKKPFFSYSPMPDPHYLFGIGKIEPIAKLNITANKLASQKLDGLELFGSPAFITSALAGFDKQNLLISPGRVFPSDAPDVSDAHIRPLSPDLRGMQNIYTEIEQLWRWSQQATGIVEDTIMGGRGQSRETATGFSGRQEGVVNRLMLEAILAGEGFVEPLANYMRALNRQFLKLPHTVKILGSSATTNPITGFPLPPEPIEIDHADVNADYRARAIGAIHMLSRSARRQDIMALTGIVQQNPAFVQVVNWVAWLRELVTIFEMNADELTNTGPTALNMAASAEGGGQAAIPDIMNLGG